MSVKNIKSIYTPIITQMVRNICLFSIDGSNIIEEGQTNCARKLSRLTY